MVDVVDLLDLGVALLRHRVEAHLAVGGEGRVQRGQALHGGRGPHVLVVVQDRQAELVLHGQDRALEPSLGPSRGGALLALHRIGVHVVAGEAVQGGDQVGRDALGHEVVLEGRGRVDRPGPAVCAHRHPAHRFDPAPDGHLGLAGHHLGGGHVAGFEARGAEAVNLNPGRDLVVVCAQDRGPGDVAALLAHRHDAAHDHVVDEAGVQPVAVADPLQHLGGQGQGGDLVQGPVLLSLAARRAHRVVDVGFGHGGPPSRTSVILWRNAVETRGPSSGTGGAAGSRIGPAGRPG